jgi:transposase
MNAHKNARTTPFDRAVMVRRVLEEGWSVAAAAAAFEVSGRTVHKWIARFRQEGDAGLNSRSSAPGLVANKLPAPWLAMITRLRREYRMTGEEIALRLRLPRSTVAGHLRRLGLGRLAALEPSEPARRYSRARAGELVHLDVKKLARFRRVGHRITGDRRHSSDGAGWEFVHVAIDDASRLAYVEVLPDEQRQSVTGFLLRALRWFKRQGIRVERVMTDNGAGYISRLFKKACGLLRLRHLRTRPTRPRPTARPSASSRPFFVSGPTPCRTAAPIAAPPTCADGCATTIRSDRMLASPASHPPPGSRLTPEQPARKPHLAPSLRPRWPLPSASGRCRGPGRGRPAGRNITNLCKFSSARK